MRKIVIALIITYFCVYAGRPGDLDFTFNRPTGYVMTEVPDSTAGGAAGIALQSDGKIIVAGLSNFEFGDGHVFLARYNTDGSLDTSFGTNGTVNHEFEDASGAMSIVIQSDDKIVIAGYAKKENKPRFLVARFTKDGALDTTTFNVAGTPGYILTLTEFDATANNAAAWKIGLQSDGTIITTGYFYTPGSYRKVAVAQYYTNGTFKSSSIFTGGEGLMATGMAIDSNDKIIIGGFYDSSDTESGFLVMRLTSAGAFDTTFASTGYKVTFITGGEGDIAMSFAVVVQTNGKITAMGLYGGTESDDFDGNIALIRYTEAGGYDPSFGSEGLVTTNVLTYSAILTGLIDTGGNIIVGGFAGVSGVNAKLLLMRYTSTGVLDTTFGVNGITLTDTPTNGELLRGMVFQSDGKIVATGGGIYFGGSEPVTVFGENRSATFTRNPIYRDGDDTTGYAITTRYLNGVSTISAANLALARRLANQWGLGAWFNTSVNFFNLMQLKGNDFGATHIRPATECKIVCTHCS